MNNTIHNWIFVIISRHFWRFEAALKQIHLFTLTTLENYKVLRILFRQLVLWSSLVYIYLDLRYGHRSYIVDLHTNIEITVPCDVLTTIQQPQVAFSQRQEISLLFGFVDMRIYSVCDITRITYFAIIFKKLKKFKYLRHIKVYKQML